jgi:hypothetical protein
MKTASQILESKNVPFEERDEIVNTLDMQIREKYKVADHAVHLWDKYYVGDAKEADLLSASGYTDIDSLLNDMTADLAKAASEYERKISFEMERKSNSVYVLSNDSFKTEEAVTWLAENHPEINGDVVDEQDGAVARHYGYKYCLIIHV